MDDASQFGVLGANTMYRHDILFDMDKNRIGIAKSDCILPKWISKPKETGNILIDDVERDTGMIWFWLSSMLCIINKFYDTTCTSSCYIDM
jgi:hypothetical protein